VRRVQGVGADVAGGYREYLPWRPRPVAGGGSRTPRPVPIGCRRRRPNQSVGWFRRRPAAERWWIGRRRPATATATSGRPSRRAPFRPGGRVSRVAGLLPEVAGEAGRRLGWPAQDQDVFVLGEVDGVAVGAGGAGLLELEERAAADQATVADGGQQRDAPLYGFVAGADGRGSGANAPSQTDDSERHRRRVSPTYGWSPQGAMDFLGGVSPGSTDQRPPHPPAGPTQPGQHDPPHRSRHQQRASQHPDYTPDRHNHHSMPVSPCRLDSTAAAHRPSPRPPRHRSGSLVSNRSLTARTLSARIRPTASGM